MGSFTFGGLLLDVTLKGANEFISTAERFDPAVRARVEKVIKSGASDIKSDASSFGHGIAYTGAFGSSFGIRKISGGYKVYSSDPGAGTIEFAHYGAVATHGKRVGRRVGVPRGSAPPRALVRAVDKHEYRIVREVEQAIQTELDKIRGA